MSKAIFDRTAFDASSFDDLGAVMSYLRRLSEQIQGRREQLGELTQGSVRRIGESVQGRTSKYD